MALRLDENQDGLARLNDEWERFRVEVSQEALPFSELLPQRWRSMGGRVVQIMRECPGQAVLIFDTFQGYLTELSVTFPPQFIQWVWQGFAQYTALYLQEDARRAAERAELDGLIRASRRMIGSPRPFWISEK